MMKMEIRNSIWVIEVRKWHVIDLGCIVGVISIFERQFLSPRGPDVLALNVLGNCGVFLGATVWSLAHFMLLPLHIITILCHGAMLEKDLYHLLALTMCYVIFYTFVMWCTPLLGVLVGAPLNY